MSEKEIYEYLLRINFKGIPAVDLKTLTRLHKLHLLNIPFENMDIHSGKKITLSIRNFYEKIVIRKRGGFCYELNGLFNELLSALGFNTYLVSARVFESADKFGEEFDHMAIIAAIDGINWLVDVGFGEFTFAPLKISIGQEQKDERGIFRISRFDNYHLLVQKKAGEGWNNEYLFSLNVRNLIEFADRCRHHQTSPESHFTQRKFCSIPTETGRVTLTDRILKVTENDMVQEIKIRSHKQFGMLLKKYFQIEG